jgi:ketosteroid isomerase-like protein
MDTSNETAANLEFVKGLYAAFKRGDMQPQLDALTEESTWQLYGPTDFFLCGLRTGKKQILDFLQSLGTTLDVKSSVQHRFIADGDTIIVLGSVHSQVKATGKEFKSEYCHVLTVRNRKLVGYREFLDTAQLIECYRAN